MSPNKVQQKAIDHVDGPAIVVAGAGTGKTFVITQRIVNLIKNKHATPKEVLALTFTNKAAEEMQERVDRELPIGEYVDWIMTFHTFCKNVLEESAVFASLESDYKLITQQESIFLFKDHIMDFSLSIFRPSNNKFKYVSDLLRFFDRLQDEVIDEDEFLNWSLSQLEKFLDDLEYDKQKLYDFLESKNIKHKKEGFEYDISSAAESALFEKEYFKELYEIPDKVELRGVLQEILSYFELARVYTEYELLKAESNLLDFGDIVIKTIKLFRERPDILKNYQDQFKYILIDEFQDTNVAQYELLKLLASDDKNMMVVGDDDQSIYKFRGASLSNILSFQQDYEDTETYVLTKNYRSNQPILDLAYKSVKNNNPYRLEVKANIDKKLQAAKGQGEGNIELMRADNDYMEGVYIAQKIGELTGLKISENIREADLKGAKWDLRKQFLSEKLQQPSKNEEGQLSLMNQGATEGDEESVKFEDIAILARSLNHVQKILDVFTYAGIPYNVQENKDLLTTSEVIFILSFLKVLVDFEDDLSLLTLLNNKYYSINPRDFNVINQKSKYNKLSVLMWLEKNFSLDLSDKDASPMLSENVNSLGIKEDTVNKVSNMFSLIAEALEKYHDNAKVKYRRDSGGVITIEKLVLDFLENLGITDRLLKEDTLEAQLAIGNIARFLRLVQAFEEKFDVVDIEKFIDYIEALRYSGAQAEEEEMYKRVSGVNIMTIHSSKGLEFDTVFLPALVRGRFPTRFRTERIQLPGELIKEIEISKDFHTQEERRLFYVGMTRAKSNLFVTYPLKYHGAKRVKKPSPFIKELELIDPEEEVKEQDEISEATFNLVKEEVKLQNFKTNEKEEKKTLWEIKNQKISYSQIQCYKTCPYKFKLRYVLNLPSAPSPVLFYGQLIHEILKNMYVVLKKTGDKMSLDEIMKMLEAKWDPGVFDTSKESKAQLNRAKTTLESYYQDFYKKADNPILLEEFFKVLLGDYVINGVFDRVDEIDNEIHIIDYKTGSLKEKKDVQKDLQLKLYAYAYSKIYGKKPSSLSLFFVEHGEKVKIKTGDDFYRNLEGKILEEVNPTIEGIVSGDFTAKPGFLCKFCEYNEVCEFAQT